MTQWEYFHLSTIQADGFSRLPLENFTTLGLDGWELVATDIRTFAVFKRPAVAVAGTATKPLPPSVLQAFADLPLVEVDEPELPPLPLNAAQKRSGTKQTMQNTKKVLAVVN